MMDTIATLPNLIRRDLGNGLTLRHACAEDAPALCTFNARIHTEEGSEEPNPKIYAWTQDLLTRPHPRFQPSDFLLIEDQTTGEIVSSLNIISQEWSYAGLPFKVGRPELVGTLPEYRNRGLVRALFEEIHTISANRGEPVQAITGIRYYYRQFGYEMALNLGGGRMAYVLHVPRLPEGQSEPFIVRPAEESDIPFLMETYAHACRRSLVACERTAEDWRYEISGKSEKNVSRILLRILQTPEGEKMGFFGHYGYSWVDAMPATIFELKPGASWAAITPTVCRYLWNIGLEYTRQEGKPEEYGAYGFWFGEDHPVYHLQTPILLPWVRPSYAWYLRVADLPAFLRHIRPVLEQRLAESLYSGFSGELKITFFRRGLRLRFDQGQIVEIEPHRPAPEGGSGDAGFPDLTFLHLVFGHRTFEELRYIYPDCFATIQAANLLSALFPKHNSNVWPIH